MGTYDATAGNYFNVHGDGNLNKKTTKTYVENVSDPNQLHQYASYNTLFTLSALSESELKDTRTLDGRPHDIIIRSSGIADGNAGNTGQVLNADNRRTLYGNVFTDGNARMAATLDKSRKTYKQDRDMYFKTVNMNAIPGLNEKRRLTSVTQIDMT